MIIHATQRHIVNQYTEKLSDKLVCCRQVSDKRISSPWEKHAVGWMES